MARTRPEAGGRLAGGARQPKPTASNEALTNSGIAVIRDLR